MSHDVDPTSPSAPRGPGAPSGGGPRRPPWLLPGGIAVALAAVALLLLARDGRLGGPGSLDGGPAETPSKPASAGATPPALASAVQGLPEVSAPRPLEIKDELPPPALWIDVLEPRQVHAALLRNEWTRATAGQPLGRGFLGTWAAFFGTKGEDLGGRFTGLVLEAFAERVLIDPYSVLWFARAGALRVPAIIVPKASPAALAAFEGLRAAAARGVLTAGACPVAGAQGAEPASEPEPEGQGAPPGEPLSIHRLLVGDQPLFAANDDGRLIFSAQAEGVLNAHCVPTAPLDAGRFPAALHLSLTHNGRALQSLAAFLGLDGTLAFAFGASAAGLAPAGLLAHVGVPGRLGGGAVDEALLKLVPVDTGLLATLQLKLPPTLDGPSLEAALAEAPDGGTSPAATPSSTATQRTVLVLWNPRGDASLEDELALVWGHGADEAALAGLLSPKSGLLKQRPCNQLVFATTQTLLDAMARSCSGSAPSVLAAAPAVAEGLRRPTSLGLSLNLGATLSQLLADGWLLAPRPLPTRGVGAGRIDVPREIDEARRRLEALPFLHFGAVLDARGQLSPGGFRS